MIAGINVAMYYMTERNYSGILDCEDSITGGGRMTFFALSGYTECCFAVMACSARFSLLHLRHCITDTAASADKNGAVTFVTFKHFKVVVVTESGVKGLEPYVHDVFMAFLAIAFGGKSRVPVVTGSARFPRFHIKHGMAHPVRPWNKNLDVTFRTGKRHLEMGAVAEHRPAGQWNFADLMTFDTVSCNGKCTLPVMAGAAGISLLHLGHGDVRIGLVCFEQGIMTIRAGEHAEMFTVSECQRPEIRNDDRYGINRVTT